MGGGEAMLAGDVDEGLPLRVGEVYACLALCCRNQVTHATIVLGDRPRPCLRGGTAKGYRPHSGEQAARDHGPFGPEEPTPGLYTHPRRKVFARRREHHARGSKRRRDGRRSPDAPGQGSGGAAWGAHRRSDGGRFGYRGWPATQGTQGWSPRRRG